jgi:hypothetical protein
MVATPIVAMVTFAIGLRVGGGSPVHAAIVYAAPRATGASTFAWQIVTLVEDHGVRETEPQAGLTVRARAKNGGEALWRGETNGDGVAEARLDLPEVRRGDPIDLEVRADGQPETLGRGRLAWDDAAWMDGSPGPFVRPTKRDGAIALDVAILGGRLAARAPTSLWVRATSREDGHPIPGAAITADPDPGLDAAPSARVTCTIGWATFTASPAMFVASLALHARTTDGRSGEWFGVLPVAAGAMTVAIAGPVKAGAPLKVEVTAPSERAGYVEVDDEVGRAAAGVAELEQTAGFAHADLSLPGLSPGLKWLVASSEPRGAETLDGATRAFPFLVLGSPAPPGMPVAGEVCADGAYLALHPAGGFRRWVALDGFVGHAGVDAARRRRGLAIALGSLAVASLLELLLVMDAARRGRALAYATDETSALVKRSGPGSVLIGVLVALLGFGLLAAFLLARE